MVPEWLGWAGDWLRWDVCPQRVEAASNRMPGTSEAVMWKEREREDSCSFSEELLAVLSLLCCYAAIQYGISMHLGYCMMSPQAC